MFVIYHMVGVTRVHVVDITRETEQIPPASSFRTDQIQVRLRKPPGSGADKIPNAPPPPPDNEAYVTPKRTLKHYTDEVFEWKARLMSHGDLDEHGKSKVCASVGAAERSRWIFSPRKTNVFIHLSSAAHQLSCWIS